MENESGGGAVDGPISMESEGAESCCPCPASRLGDAIAEAFEAVYGPSLLLVQMTHDDTEDGDHHYKNCSATVHENVATPDLPERGALLLVYDARVDSRDASVAFLRVETKPALRPSSRRASADSVAVYTDCLVCVRALSQSHVHGDGSSPPEGGEQKET